MDEESTNKNNGIVDPIEPEATAPIPEDASPVAGEATPTATPAVTPLTGERVLDIALGAAVIAGEALDKASKQWAERAKQIQDQAPAFWETAEERGRPVREQLVSSLKGGSGNGTATGTAPVTEGAAPESGSGLADSLRNLGREIGISVGGGNARLSAEEEIRSLEDRVRELEQVVVSGKTGVEPEIPEAPETPVAPEVKPESPEAATTEVEAPLSENEPEIATTPSVEASGDSEATTAESSSYAFGVDQHEDFLDASPYSVSETDDERAIVMSGLVVDSETEPTIERETGATTDEPTAPETTPTTPPSGRASRKKQRDFDPEATDDSTTTPAPEA
jgi:hypothetical protein